MGMDVLLPLQKLNARARTPGSRISAQHQGAAFAASPILHSIHTVSIRDPYAFQTPRPEASR
jgi:hypothetical protein